MPDKILVNLKDDTFNRLFIAYVGARQISNTITRSTLITQIIRNSFDGESTILFDKRLKHYSSKDLYELGLKIINNFFESLDKMSKIGFYKFINETDFQGKTIHELDLFNELDIKKIIISFFKNTYTYMDRGYMTQNSNEEDKDIIYKNIDYPKLNNADYDILYEVITYEEEFYVKEKEEYNFNKKIQKVISRIKGIILENNFNKLLTDIFQEIYTKSQLINKYIIELGEKEVSNDNLNIRYDFYKEFYQYISCVENINNLFEENKEKVIEYYREIYVERIYNCHNQCEECLFNLNICYKKWLAQDLKELVKEILLLDIKTSIEYNDGYFLRYNYFLRHELNYVDNIRIEINN